MSLLYCTEEKYRSPTFPVATTKNLTVETFLLGANFVLEGAKGGNQFRNVKGAPGANWLAQYRGCTG